MTVSVDVELIEGLALPYVAGAETGLDDADLDPVFATAWAGLVAAFPAATLLPLFDGLPVDVLADLVDAIRTGGDEPPDPFSWFTVLSNEADADALTDALQALPLINFAGQRSGAFVAGVSYGTNPETVRTTQILEAPLGIDAIYAWSVAGGTGTGVALADIEGGWSLSHQELLTAAIRKVSVFGSESIDHGTAVAGILVAADNGVGMVGIVPDASLGLVTDNRGTAVGLPAAITVAANAVGVGGVVLIEDAAGFRTPPGADVPIEFERPVQVATRLATLFGVTVIEPAGNGGINLDTTPALAHTRPGSPTFVDSRTIMVGAGEVSSTGGWQRTFSSFGSRVDCFGPGSRVRAPSSSAPDAYQDFGGTSSASAVIAGAAASLQGMVQAATGQLLGPTDIRRLFRDPALTTASQTPGTDLIGSMPDLRKIALSQGLPRILPLGAAATPGGGAVLVSLDDENRLVRRHWTLFTGWGMPLPVPGPLGGFHLTAGQAAVTSVEETAPTQRLLHEAYLLGAGGVHHLFWDSLGQTGDITQSIAPNTVVSQGSSLGVVRVLDDRVVVAGVGPDGHLVIMTGEPDVLSTATPLTDPLVIDTVGQYRRTNGPTVVSRAPATGDVVVVEDGGTLQWFAGNVLATIGTGWSDGRSDPSGTTFDPGARLALLVLADALLVAGVDGDGHLVTVGLDPVAVSFGAATVIDPGTTLASSGPVALALAGPNVVALAIDTGGILRTATRPAAGGDFGSFSTVLSDVVISPLGGVTAISLPGLGVMALVVDGSGTSRFALSPDGVLWPPLLPIF